MAGHASNFSIDTILSSSSNMNDQEFDGFSNYCARGFNPNNFSGFSHSYQSELLYNQFSTPFNSHLRSLELLAGGQSFLDQSAFQIKTEPVENLIRSSQFSNEQQNYSLPTVEYVHNLQTTNPVLHQNNVLQTVVPDNKIDYSSEEQIANDGNILIHERNLLKRRRKLHPIEEPQEQPSSTTDCHQGDRKSSNYDKESDHFADVVSCQNEDNGQNSKPFPNWTQKQKQGWQGRRPYSRTCTIILGWWFKHFQYLTTGEMSQVGNLTGLTRQQVKIWWQNKRHTMRTKSVTGLAVKETALEAGLPLMLPEGIRPPTPHSRRREDLFKQMFHFFHIHIKPMIFYHHS